MRWHLAPGILRLATLLTVAASGSFVGSPDLFGWEFNPPKHFPADAVVNIQDYGAKGDGTPDDTAALKKAIEENIGQKRILFFPKGTYLVSDTLPWKDAEGRWKAWLSLQGESALTTVIRLKDATFTDAEHPKPVIMTASQNPLSPADGGGNQAFGISVCDLTVDVGKGNVGAIGIEYLANNKGMLENVVVRSSDPNHCGTAGVAMLRPFLGPCFLKNVEVVGFDCGIDVAQPDASATMEHIVLKNQRVCALRNADNCLAIRDLVGENSVPAVISRRGKQNRYGPGGLVILVDSKLLGGSSDHYAIENSAHLFVRNTQTTGYKAAILDRGKEVPSVADGEYVSQIIPSKFGGLRTSLNLPVVETPTYWDNDLAHWKSVGKPNGTEDTARIQAALDSGATTVYFQPGEYRISDTLFVRGRVKHLIGMDALLRPAKRHPFTKQPDTKAVFRFETPDDDVSVVVFERFNLFFQQGGRAIENASRKDLVIRSVISWASGGGYRNEPGAGRLFIEDFDPGNHQNDYTLFRGQKVWARQFDPEPRQGPHVVNDGGDLWILGYKTKGIGPVMLTKGGGRTEVLGGLHIWPIE
jgi:hypothetical protein